MGLQRSGSARLANSFRARPRRRKERTIDRRRSWTLPLAVTRRPERDASRGLPLSKPCPGVPNAKCVSRSGRALKNSDIERLDLIEDNKANERKNTVQPQAVNLAYAEPCPDERSRHGSFYLRVLLGIRP